jgi:flagellar hook-associated protein 2
MEVSASRFAEETSYQLEVLQLAQADVWASKTFSSQDQALGLEGLLRINGLEIQISPEDTLQTIRDKINSLGGDFKASIIKVNEGEFVLFLKGEKTGETNALTLEDPNDLFGFQNLIQAQDALLKVNGLMVQRSSNTINDLFKGLTIQLKRALPGTTISLEVKRDTDSLIGKIEDFVNAYNQVVSFFNEQFSYQEGTIKPLMGDVTLRGIKSTLVSLILQKADLPEGLNALTFIGINLQKDGSLTFNKEAFLEKFSMDPENTSSLLQKVSTNLKEYLDKLITPFSGLLNVKTDILQRQIQRINEQIDRQQYLIEQEKERLRRQFLALEEALGQLKSLSNWLSQQIEISFKNSK